MNHLRRLFCIKPVTVKPFQNPTLIIQEYRPIQYAYSCDYCVKNIIKVKVLGLTEMFCGPFTDPEGNKHHCHDYNTGQVEVTCEDNHISKTHYVACCECGWTNNKRLPL